MSRSVAELSEADRRWASCAGCHSRIGSRPAVWLGRPSFQAPAVCVCADCLRAALELVEKR